MFTLFEFLGTFHFVVKSQAAGKFFNRISLGFLSNHGAGSKGKPPVRRKGEIIKLPVLNTAKRVKLYDEKVLNCSYTWQQCENGTQPLNTTPATGMNVSLSNAYKTPAEEGFTMIVMMYKRDGKLKNLEKFEGLPHLKAVIVIWNDWERAFPSNVSVKLHVPVYYVNGTYNSLNNRFLPLDLIKTEAVLSMDDDFIMSLNDILFAYRVWKDHKYALVGAFARLVYIENTGNGLYNAAPRCAYNTILTGAAFMHRSYLYAYTYSMPSAVREHVDKFMNCEDIAMNFLVANMTGSAPIRTVTLTKDILHPKPTTTTPKPRTSSAMTTRKSIDASSVTKIRAKRGLSDRAHHYEERARCVERFTLIYGHNPLVKTSYYAQPAC